MKKILLVLIFLGSLLCSFGQNPTVVRPTNGLDLATANTSGVVYPRLKTNNQNNATQQVYGHTAAGAFQWYDASTLGGTPGGSSGNIQYNNAGAFGGSNSLNIVFDANGASHLTNTVGSFEVASKGAMTNSAPSFFGNWSGAVTFGDANAVQMFREATGLGWSIRSTPNANIGFLIGSTFGVRGAASTSGSTIGNGDTSFIYAEDASGGSFNHILPTANVNNMKWFKFYKNDTTTNYVSITAPSGTLFSNGQTNYVLRSKGDSFTVWNNGGATWDILSESSYPKHWSSFHDEDTIVSGAGYASAADSAYNYCHVTYQNPAATNDQFKAYFNLKRGTYVFRLQATMNNLHGIVTWYVDDTQIGTTDLYAASIARDQFFGLTNVVIRESGSHKLTGLMRSKNASSSDFFAPITKWWWEWTSD